MHFCCLLVCITKQSLLLSFIFFLRETSVKCRWLFSCIKHFSFMTYMDGTSQCHSQSGFNSAFCNGLFVGDWGERKDLFYLVTHSTVVWGHYVSSTLNLLFVSSLTLHSNLGIAEAYPDYWAAGLVCYYSLATKPLDCNCPGQNQSPETENTFAQVGFMFLNNIEVQHAQWCLVRNKSMLHSTWNNILERIKAVSQSV